jgi:pimeloyl-[acyl-carrier protein] methyl ester esterase
VLAHGWGFHAGIWKGLREYLPGAEFTFIDLGFIRGGPKDTRHWSADAIAVGHSLGVLWLLQQATAGRSAQFGGLVSIQGFDCFTCHISPARVASMRRELKRDPGRTVEGFWQACGTNNFARREALDADGLDEGLGWLLAGDAREAKATLGRPILALAARNDPIVPPWMTESIWGDNVRWSETGGHVLPLLHPEWCARHVLDFAQALRP